MTTDPFDLQRFVDAQARNYETALAEIRRGAKRGHWMWYVFPQIAGLGRSAMAQHYAIRSAAEALAYLDHPVLGARFAACVAALDGVADANAERVFGGIDAIKLRSSLTLFDAVRPDPAIAAAIGRWFGGGRDDATLGLLAGDRGSAATR